jgi:hypothetical protein
LTIKASMTSKRNDSPLNNKNLKKSIFTVPKDYFELLSEKVRSKISTEESELMKSSILRQNVFQTPDNYFENLKSSINARIEQPESKVVPMYKYQWLRYAAAAVILIGIAIFGLQKQQEDINLLAGVPDLAIIEYLEEKQAIEYDLLLSVTDLNTILDDMIIEETSSLSFAMGEHPELDYEFEYLDY